MRTRLARRAEAQVSLRILDSVDDARFGMFATRVEAFVTLPPKESIQ
jgi:hypothetical protein